jgi:hypothetical protein
MGVCNSGKRAKASWKYGHSLRATYLNLNCPHITVHVYGDQHHPILSGYPVVAAFELEDRWRGTAGGSHQLVVTMEDLPGHTPFPSGFSG